jgi:hypothetical protein
LVVAVWRRQGLVVRHEGCRDRQRRRVEITPAGRECLRALEAERRKRLERYVDRLDRPRRLRLAGALHLLSGRLDGDLAHPESPGGSPRPLTVTVRHQDA